MVDLRKDKRAPASLKVKYKSATVDEFRDQIGTDISRGGIFIKTKKPIENGAVLKLELQLSDASPVIHGIGRVCWRREQSTDPDLPAGMGIKFIKLDPSSRSVVERIIQVRGDRPSRFDQTLGAELAAPSQPPPPAALSPVAPKPSELRNPLRAPMPSMPTAAARAAVPRAPAPPVPRAPLPPLTSAPRSPTARADLPPPPASILRGGSPAAPSAKSAGAGAATVAGLFANSPLVTSAPSIEPSPETKRNSFFPPAPNANGTGSTRPSVPGISGAGRLNPPASTNVPAGPKPGSGNLQPAARADQARQSGQFLAAAFAEGGVAEDTATQARAVADNGEDALIDELFAGVVHEQARAQSSPASVDDVFASLSEEEGLSESPVSPPTGRRASSPGSAPSRDSVPSAAALRRASIASSEPLRGSQPNGVDELFTELDARDAGRGSKAPEPTRAAAAAPAQLSSFVDDEDLGSDSDAPFAGDSHEWSPGAGAQFGEADLFGAVSVPPSLPLSLKDAGSAPQTSEQPQGARASALRWVVLALVLALGGAAAFLYYQQRITARSDTVQKVIPLAPRPAPQPKPELAPDPPAAAAVQPEPTPAAGGPATQAAQGATDKPAAPAAAELAPMQNVEVEISSVPRDSELSVDGKRIGTTPRRIVLPIGREAHVTVSYAGYASMTKTVVPSSSTEPLRFKLEPLPYSLTVRTTPPQAAIVVGPRSAISPAPLDLGHLDGGVQVSVAKDGYQRVTRLVRIDEFVEKDGVMRAEVEVALNPLPSVSHHPKRARAKTEAEPPPAPEPPTSEAAPFAPPPSATKPAAEGAPPEAAPPVVP